MDRQKAPKKGIIAEQEEQLATGMNILLVSLIDQYPDPIKNGVTQFVMQNKDGARNSVEEIHARAMKTLDFLNEAPVMNSMARVSTLYHEESGRYPTMVKMLPYTVHRLCELNYSGKSELAIRATELLLFTDATAKILETGNLPRYAKKFVDSIIDFLERV